MNTVTTDKNVNEVLRGTKYNNYSKKIPVDKPIYDGEIFERIEGNSFIGKYVDKLENVGKYGSSIYIFESDRLDGKFDKVFSCAVLDRQMKEVDIGEIVEIKYIGYDESKNYHEYKVSRIIYEQDYI